MTDGLPTLDEVKAEVTRIDPSLTEGHRYFKTAVFLVAAAKGVGQSDVALAKFTGYSRGWLIRRIKNIKKAGIWAQGQFHHRWYDEGFGAVELRLDIKTAEGEIEEQIDAADAKKARGDLAAMVEPAEATPTAVPHAPSADVGDGPSLLDQPLADVATAQMPEPTHAPHVELSEPEHAEPAREAEPGEDEADKSALPPQDGHAPA